MARIQMHGRLMTVPQVAEYLGIGVEAARHLIKSGEIHSYKVGTEYRCVSEAIELWIMENCLPKSREQVRRRLLESDFTNPPGNLERTYPKNGVRKHEHSK